MSTKQGKELASKLGIEYYECSALKNEGIDEAMIGLVKTITRDYEKRQETAVTMGFPEP